MQESPTSEAGRAGPALTSVRKALLACGIASSLLYAGTDLLGALRYEGYRYTSQTVSELSAIGSPTRPLVVPLFMAYGSLVTAFGFGVRGAAGSRRRLRVMAGLLIGLGLICVVGPFTPMHQREALAAGEKTLTDTLHILGATVDVLFILLIVGFGGTAFGRRFRLYSIGTILVVIVSGALAGLDGPRLEANLPTPWVGVKERISILGFLLWVVLLAIGLLRASANGGRAAPPELLKATVAPAA